MAARLVVLCVGALALTPPPASASDAVDPIDLMVAVKAATVGTVAPGSTADDGERRPLVDCRISARLSQRNRDQLAVGFQVAVERVREVPDCRELFNELGADGLATLGRVSFYPIGYREARPDVCRGSVAFTLVGGGPTWVCRDFWRLTDNQAAMIVIHEALHHAGLAEQPRDPNAMTSAAINRMVERRCGR